jgi:3-hydroxybutyrate dehydrogenase
MILAGKTALVTGSTSGIGLGVARVLAWAGANIMLNGFGAAVDIEAARKSLGNVKTHYSPADMRKPEEIRAMAAEAEKLFGRIDILVNNAGIQHVAGVESFPEGKWDDIIAINLSAAFHASKAALPAMRKNGFGRIVNIASVHGLVASKDKAAYVAAKHGLVGLTKVIALETAGSGVTCNAVCPGFVLTPLVQKQIDARAEQQRISPEQAAKSLLAEKQPALSFVTTEQIGEIVRFLCSPAADLITGTALPVDGGWTAQ